MKIIKFTQLIKLCFGMSVLLLFSCSADIEQYEATTPGFTLEKFFNGQLIGYGVVTDFNDNITRRFKVDINASWQGNQGILDEHFTYNDGETQFRQWKIQKLNQQQYQGQADDIIGNATGRSSGAVITWKYTMMLKVDDEVYEVDFDDTMILIDDNHMINTAKIFKFGVNVGNVTIFFDKKP